MKKSKVESNALSENFRIEKDRLNNDIFNTITQSICLKFEFQTPNRRQPFSQFPNLTLQYVS